jgi:hypothetical protein
MMGPHRILLGRQSLQNLPKWTYALRANAAAHTVIEMTAVKYTFNVGGHQGHARTGILAARFFFKGFRILTKRRKQ